MLFRIPRFRLIFVNKIRRATICHTLQSCFVAHRGLGTGIPSFRFDEKKGGRNDIEKLTEYTAHDFAGIFTNDINTYLEKGGFIDNLSATNVFNVINDESEEDRFAFTKNVVMSALDFRTESMAISYLMKHISLQEGNFALNKESIPLLRNQIAGEKDFYVCKRHEFLRSLACAIILPLFGTEPRGFFKVMVHRDKDELCRQMRA